MARAGRVQRTLVRAGSALNVQLYRRTGGRLGGRVNAAPLLMLTTTGRRSGEQRTRPVAYLRDGQRYVVCGSYGGSDTTPAWVLNLRAHPRGTVEVDGRALAVTSREAEGAEYDRLWSELSGRYANFEGYRRRTERHLPLLVLEPAPAA